jgi:cytochrome aa3-600 menaquinol oxidase subunit 2
MKKLTLKSFGVLTLLLVFLSGCTNNIAVLNPQGPVARTEFHLIIWSFAIMALVVIAVLIIFVYVLVRYGRKNSTGYDPNDHGSIKLEATWIIIPIILCVLIAVPTVNTLFNLENPPKALGKTVEKKPITIEVTSVDWKWLFRYPDQKIETVNYVVIPEDRPVKFKLNAIGAMNSFWVPQLGGQQYTMPNMDMKLWLLADHPGDYLGRSANFSGRGFTDMDFHVLAKTQGDYEKWISKVKKTEPALTMEKYRDLLKPSNVGRMTFSGYPKQLEKKSNTMHMSNPDSKNGRTQTDGSSMNMDGGMDHGHE